MIVSASPYKYKSVQFGLFASYFPISNILMIKQVKILKLSVHWVIRGSFQAMSDLISIFNSHGGSDVVLHNNAFTC